MEKPDKIDKFLPGSLAHLIIVDGNPLEVITVLQELEKIPAVMKDQAFHREPVEETPATPETADVAMSHL